MSGGVFKQHPLPAAVVPGLLRGTAGGRAGGSGGRLRSEQRSLPGDGRSCEQMAGLK